MKVGEQSRNVALVKPTSPNETKVSSDTLLWTKPETARHIRCSIRHVENEVKRRALACVRFGTRCIRFRPQDVARYIDNRRLRAVGE